MPVHHLIRADFRRAALVLAISTVPAYGAQADTPGPVTVGPSVQCRPKPIDALSLLSCSDAKLARADLWMVQTYYAMRGGADPDRRKALKSQFLQMIIATRQSCGLPPVAPSVDQSDLVLPQDAAACVTATYDKQRAAWLLALSGPASEEAARPPEQNLLLQGRLKSLGFLPAQERVDGVFGTVVRDAVSRWQTSAGRPATGFLSDADAVALSASSASAPTPSGDKTDPVVRYASPPLATDHTEGQTQVVSYRDLSVLLDMEPVRDPKICLPPYNGGFGFQALTKKSDSASCDALVGKISVAGTIVHQIDLAAVDNQASADELRSNLTIRNLDVSSPHPQVVFTAYTGGAHCCTVTIVSTETKAGAWSDINLGSVDGDEGFGFISVPPAKNNAFASYDDSFNYAFASNAGSFSPTQIRAISGISVTNVSREPAYRELMVARLKLMENQYRSTPLSSREPNGFYAGWVAQEAQLGEFDQSWRVMLGSYDHNPGLVGTTTICAIDTAILPKDSHGYAACPSDQEISIPFPEALAVLLVNSGYVSIDQAKAVGFDVPAIKANRLLARQAATERYRATDLNSWFIATNVGGCVEAKAPPTPADLVSYDRENGLQDTIVVTDRGADGKASAVRIGEPKGDGLVTVTSFYRGLAACQAAQRETNSQLDDLR